MTQQEQYYWQQMQRQNTLRAYYNAFHQTQMVGAVSSDTNTTFAAQSPTPQYFSLTVSKSGSGEGNIQISLQSGSYDQSTSKYKDGSIVNLKAIPSEDSGFDTWNLESGDNSSQSINITINKDISVNAVFAIVDDGAGGLEPEYFEKEQDEEQTEDPVED